MNLETSVLKTIRYARKFGSELTMEEIKERLISDKVWSNEEINSFLKSKNFEIKKLKKEKPAKSKMEKAEKLTKLIEKKFKDILMIGITGSVATGHPKKEDDIDFIIITKKNRLWETRLKLRRFIYKNKIPHRKYGQKENRNDFCFNLWLDENNLLIPKNRCSLRTAMDLILMKPILDRNNTYQKFILKNGWAKEWVATGYDRKIKNFKIKSQKNKIRNNLFWKIINFLVFLPQYWFMRRKMKNGESVSLGQAFFNTKKV